MIFYEFWSKNAGINKKRLWRARIVWILRVFMTKIFPVFNKTIRDIIEREGANSPLQNTEESQNPRSNRVK